MEEKVVLVDKNNIPLGTMDKIEAHQKGLLHRAFSVFVLNKNKEILLQKRALSKYHSGGLWSNTCCSHPYENENILVAGKRRLYDEMGFETALKELFTFIYKAELENGLVEHELDHVLLGAFEGNPFINKKEVGDWKWMPLKDIEKDLKVNAKNYTIWFNIIFKRFYQYIKDNYESNN